MVALLMISAWESSSLQKTGSAEEMDAYHSYVSADDATAVLRRIAWTGSTQVRDFLLSRDEDRQTRFEGQIRLARAQAVEPLRTLQTLSAERFRRLAVEEQMHAFFTELKQIAEIAPATPRKAHRLIPPESLGMRRIEVQNAAHDYLQAALQDWNQAHLRFRAGQAVAQQRLFLLLGIAVGAGFLIAGVSLRYASHWDRDRARYYREIEEANQRLEHLSARLLDIQEEERARLSRELHDEVGQTLTALRMEISGALQRAAIGSPGREHLQRARELTERTVHVVRDLSLMLRPSILDDLGLGSAIQWQLEEFSRRSHAEVEFRGNQDAGEHLPEAIKTCVFRITQEALHNIEKYASASHVTVRLSQQYPEVLLLEVEDNGIGFDPTANKSPRASGILGMQERVAHLQGRFRIESKPGEGTHIYVALPVPVEVRV